MNIIGFSLLALLTGCTSKAWHVPSTYGTRYLLPVSEAVYAEYEEFDIVDRPDLQSIYVIPSVKTALSGKVIKASTNEPLYRNAAKQYLNLDRVCEITNAETLKENLAMEYLYSCKKQSP